MQLVRESVDIFNQTRGQHPLCRLTGVPDVSANITNIGRKVNALDVPANYVILTYGYSSLIERPASSIVADYTVNIYIIPR